MAVSLKKKSGVADKVEDEDEGVVEAVSSMRFPAGTKALFKRGRGGQLTPLGDEERVFVINVSLQRVSFRTKDDAIQPSKDYGYREETITMLPGEAREIRVVDARRVLSALERRGGDLKLVVAPPKGNCENEIFYHHPAPAPGAKPAVSARRFQTCPYAGCPHHPLPRLPSGLMVQWSVWQSQHRIARLGTEPAIRRWIETFDPRPDVVSWGLYTMQRREQSRRERMMLGDTRNQSATAVY